MDSKALEQNSQSYLGRTENNAHPGIIKPQIGFFRPRVIQNKQHVAEVAKLRLKRLRNAKLKFDNYKGMRSKDLRKVVQHIRDQKKVQYLDMRPYRYNLQVIRTFRLKSKSSSCFSSINIDLNGYGDVSDERLKYLSVNYLKGLRSLSSLSMNLSKCTNVKGFSGLFSGLKYLRGLKALTLDLTINRGLTDKCLRYFSHICQHLRSLTLLKINFYSCTSFTTKGFIIFVQGLSNLSKLSNLELYLNGVHIQSNQMLTTMRTIGHNLACLKSLTSLNLNFDYWRSAGNESVQALFTGIKELSGLKILKLSFVYVQVFDSKGLNSLWEAIKNQRDLSELDLNFDYCMLLDDNAFEDLPQALERLNVLSKLTLSLKCNNCMADVFVQNLMAILPKMQSLNEIFLNLQGCIRMSRKVIDDLTSMLKLPKVQILRF